MTERVPARDLRIGMYVCLPGGWLSHSFLKGRFRIRSEGQIQKIIQSGFEEVDVDRERSDPAPAGRAVQVCELDRPDDEPGPISLCEFAVTVQEIDDLTRRSMPPQEKAEAVYHQSIEVMQRLFENPSASFIGSSKKVVSKVVDLILADDDTTDCLLKVSTHDEYTYTHSMNVGVYATALAKKIYRGRDGHNMRELGAGFFLHDLGKIRIPPEILGKPSRLTPEEFAVIKLHPQASHDILRETSQLSDECSVIALQHHEREDGSGYPCGLRGDEIHDYARICSIADVFDALTSKRSYRDPSTAFGAIQIMRDEMLGHFHKEMLRDFIMLFRG